MADVLRKILDTTPENLTKYVVFSVEFNGIIRIFDFRQDITIKFPKN